MTRLINSDEIQSVIRPAGQAIQKSERNKFVSCHNLTSSLGPFTQKKNPLRNKAVLFRLNPYAKTIRRQELLRQERKAKKGSVKKSIPAAAGKEFSEILHAA